MHRNPFWLESRLGSLAVGILAISLALGCLPHEAKAQNIVIAKFVDRSKHKLGKKAWAAIARQLKNRGAKIVSYKQYMRLARKSRIRTKNALKPRSIRKISKKLDLDAVVWGSAKKRRRRYTVSIRVFGSNGKLILKKNYQLKRPAFSKKTASSLADLIMEKLGSGEEKSQQEVAEADTKKEPTETKTESTGTATDDKKSTGTNDAFLPAWARSDKEGSGGNTTTAKTKRTTEAVVKNEPDEHVEEPAPSRHKRSKMGSVNDLLVAVGGSFHHRSGLSPKHEASMFPGIRVDARMFMGTFLDIPVVRDIGIGGMFDMSMGLEYGYADADSTWSAQQMQWRGELIYRLALDTGLQPAFMLRLGYGSTSSVIDKGEGDLALSAGYMSPYASLDIYLMLFKPYLRLFVSGGFLFLVSPGEDLAGSGMGFNVFAGFDVDMFKMVHVGIGYDLTQYMMNDDSADGMGEYSDTYQSFFLRVGYNYN